MRATIAVVLALTLGSLSLSAPVVEEGYASLFDGKSLDGWKPFLRAGKDGTTPDPKTVWSIKDEAIICTGKPNGYIVTEKEYGDFVLKLKWRFPADSKGGNSGVLLHVTGPDKVWPNSVEAQLAAGQAGDFWLIVDDKNQLPKLEIDESRKDPKNKEGRHYFRIDKDSPVEKPFGEWNEYEITCKGGDIVLVVNGKKVNEGKNGQLKKGRIALQSEGAEIHFKDIRIKSLN